MDLEPIGSFELDPALPLYQTLNILKNEVSCQAQHSVKVMRDGIISL